LKRKGYPTFIQGRRIRRGMRTTMKIVAASALFILLCAPAVRADSGLESFISSLNVRAEADLGKFKAQLSAQFGVPGPEVEVLLRSVDRPADAYLCLRSAEIMKLPTDMVVREYRVSKEKGWGVIAKNLGIKPGSAAFHALKSGNVAHDSAGNGARESAKVKSHKR